MNILAIDTTTKNADVSLEIDNKITHNKVENEITHSEKLLPLINECFNKTNSTINDINVGACITGPGSFTGIRIGLSTIKAFAQVKKFDIFCLNSLKALAYSTYIKENYKDKRYVLSLIDSRNNRVYYSLYKIDYILDKINIEDCTLISNDDIETTLHKISNYIEVNKIQKLELIITGDCTKTHIDLSQNILNIDSKYCISNYPTSKDLIHAIHNIYNINDYIENAYTLDANYARPSQAERIKNGED